MEAIQDVWLTETCDPERKWSWVNLADLAEAYLLAARKVCWQVGVWASGTQALVANRTYTLVPLPPGRIAVGTKWLFKIKSCRVIQQGGGQR